jgi:hypothetical protein
MNSQPVLSAEGQMVSNALQQAVANALDRKWRLGQYAVISVDNKPVIIEGEALKTMAEQALNATTDFKSARGAFVGKVSSVDDFIAQKEQEKSLNNGT